MIDIEMLSTNNRSWPVNDIRNLSEEVCFEILAFILRKVRFH